MNLTRHLSIVSVAAFGVVLLSASPALAQHRGGGGSRGTASVRSAPSRQAGSSSSRVSGSQVYSSPQRSSQRIISSPQASTSRAVASPQAIAPRAQYSGQAVARPGGGFGQNNYRRFSSPYYSFRPRFSIGLGFFVGYPVDYPYYALGYGYPYGGYPYYDDPYDSPYAYAAPYDTYGSAPAPAPDPGYVNAAPGATTAAVGGVSLDVNPATAAVFLDGVYVGVVSDFSPTQPPLTIASGKHRLELRAQGYATLAFDLTVVAGQVTPFQGAMQIK